MPSRRSKRSKSTSGSTGLQAIADRLGPRTVIGLRAAGWAVLTGLLVAGGLLGIPTLKDRAEARNLLLDDPIEVRFVGGPAWFEDDHLRMELADTVRRAIGEDHATTRDAGLRRALEGLERTGWFEQVTQVRWIDPTTVAVDAEWVVPIALVDGTLADGERRAFLVDSAGRRLELDYPIGAAGLPELLRIKGVSEVVPPAPGERWGDDVDAALALHRVIHDAPWYDLVRSIDTRRHATDREVELHTDRSTIVWGSPPGQWTLAENTDRDKILIVEQLATDGYLKTDAIYDIRSFDIHRDDAILDFRYRNPEDR
ncbi:MAG: hypothetical protein ACYTDE_01845 [Planctomycetota bacterium]|jgi:hypothetical protein